jgi:hypothetical protein
VLIDEVQDGTNWTVHGTFQVPYFLDEDFGLPLDDDGLPIQHETRDIEFLLVVPDTIDGPRPLICYGHGFFSSKGAIAGGSYNRLLQSREFSSIALDFRGFSEQDIAQTVPILSGELDHVPGIAHRQVQNVANFTLLARLDREQLAAYVELGRGD